MCQDNVDKPKLKRSDLIAPNRRMIDNLIEFVFLASACVLTGVKSTSSRGQIRTLSNG